MMAIVSVIVIHVFQTWPDACVMNFKIISLSSLFKFCVPVFLMLSGALLLNRNIELSDFFKRRFTRLTYPFILHMILYVLVLGLLIVFFDKFNGLSIYIDNVPLAYNWYFWTIFSVYLGIPIINKFIQHSTQKEIEYFIYVFFIGSIFYQLILYFGIIQYINLNLFVSPFGYLVLGYYLDKKEFNFSSKKIVSLSLLAFAVVTLIKMGTFLNYFPNFLVVDTEAARSAIVYSWMDFGFIQLIQASAVFLCIKYLYSCEDGFYNKIKNCLERNLINRFIESVSKASYGMYLVHHTILEPLRIVILAFPFTGTQVCLMILILSVGLNAVCWLIICIMNRIPFIGQFSGYH